MGLAQLLRFRLPSLPGGEKISRLLSLLILRDRPLPTFLFGFSTVFLPCGQTVIVFAACAITGSGWTGWLNGLAFALLTSPSLWFAMRVRTWLPLMRRHYNTIMGVLALIVGGVAICRGFADLELIPHLVLFPRLHLVIF